MRGLLNLYDRTAQKLYCPRNYTEEDYLCGLLLWQLGGARLAGIGHHALGLPSETTLRHHMGVDDDILNSEVLVAEALSEDETLTSRRAPARRPAIWNIIQESDSESEREENVASEGATEGWVGETGVDFEGGMDLETRSDSLYAEPSTTMFHCPSNDGDTLDTNDTVVPAVVVQEVGLPADKTLDVTDAVVSAVVAQKVGLCADEGFATDLNVPTASANSDLRSLREGLRNTSKRKLVRECDCGESIDKVEADDESRIIITDYAVPSFVCWTGSWYQRLGL